MTNHAVFLDRDGTLNVDPGYLGEPEKLQLFPRVGEALSLLKNDHRFLLIVISNQSGIARGLITRDQVNAVNSKINALLEEFNVTIDAFYYCPFHPEFNDEESVKCRKPSPEMVLNAAKEFNIDLSKSYFVGDSVSDILCGINAAVKTILVLTGDGKDSLSILQNDNNFPSFVAENIFDAANFIIKDFSGVYN